jgi:phage shock protein E
MKFILSVFAALAVVCGNQAQVKTAKPETSAAAAKKNENIGPEGFDKIRKTDPNAVVLDVRTKEEYQKGHIAGSTLIDFNSPDFEKQIAKLDKNKTYLVHCAAGGRSAKACKKMETLNFSKLYNLEGGLGAWQKAGKPVEK